MVKHPVILRGYGADLLDDQAAPVLVKRTDPDFLDGLLDQLRERTARLQLGEPLDRAGGRIKLRQPIHRTFNLIVLEAACEQPGRPRLNPRRIESAGFVVRRVQQASQPFLDEAWQRRGKSILGWRTAGTAEAARLDPDPARRSARGLPAAPGLVPLGVQRALDLIRRDADPPAEAVIPLFVAPPDVCEATGRTVLYGVVPVSSAEFREDRPPETYDVDVVTSLMPEFLRSGSGNYQPNGSSRTLTPAEVEASEATGLTDTRGLFLLGLRTLHSVLRLFSDPRDATFIGLLNEIRVTLDNHEIPLGSYLEQIARDLIERRRENLTIRLPETWPLPSVELAAALVREARRILNAQFARQGIQIRRFEEPGALYRIHAFVRTRGEEGCRGELHWSAPSEVFTIAPWWETGPLHTIQLPDLGELRNLKPNVAFALPPGLANLLNRSNPKKLAEGEGSTGGLDLGWICSFSLPAITLCAFIVLNIFLSLFDLIFQWLFFIKICLPFPKKLIPPAP